MPSKPDMPRPAGIDPHHAGLVQYGCGIPTYAASQPHELGLGDNDLDTELQPAVQAPTQQAHSLSPQLGSCPKETCDFHAVAISMLIRHLKTHDFHFCIDCCQAFTSKRLSDNHVPTCRIYCIHLHTSSHNPVQISDQRHRRRSECKKWGAVNDTTRWWYLYRLYTDRGNHVDPPPTQDREASYKQIVLYALRYKENIPGLEQMARQTVPDLFRPKPQIRAVSDTASQQQFATSLQFNQWTSPRIVNASQPLPMDQNGVTNASSAQYLNAAHPPTVVHDRTTVPSELPTTHVSTPYLPTVLQTPVAIPSQVSHGHRSQHMEAALAQPLETSYPSIINHPHAVIMEMLNGSNAVPKSCTSGHYLNHSIVPQNTIIDAASDISPTWKFFGVNARHIDDPGTYGQHSVLRAPMASTRSNPMQPTFQEGSPDHTDISQQGYRHDV